MMPEPSEAENQRAILGYLRIRGHLVKRNQSGTLQIQNKQNSRFIHMGERGWPDIIGIAKGTGQFIGVEVKSRKGRTSTEQEIILAEIRARGGIGIVARSVDDVIQAGL